MIRKVLVANRGEIARRVFRTCREMGISTAAVASDVDLAEPHALEAEETAHIGAAAPSESYLRIEAILDAAKRTGADAVHPGYGFLAENAAFAAAVIEAGLVWIGPPPQAIARMGSKVEAKRLMTAAGIPVLPGFEPEDLLPSGAVPGPDGGYPLLVKASAGGGGKGMRIVTSPGELGDAVAAARREAASAFGDDTVFVERYIEAPRHIEIQVCADDHGHTVSLLERECSVQRRHQKIIEEAPSPALDQETRERMGRAAVAAAEAVGYRGAGTVEFLYRDGEFWFLEMNTRLQVEHPVTEMITGLDLVRLQILVAQGQPLPHRALHPEIDGHAVEARLYAEDPENGFLPVTGRVHRFRFPEVAGVRVDSGVGDGSLVTPHYDPLLAKVIAHAPSRDEALAKLASALQEAEIHAATTNRALLVRILRHPEMMAGETDTHFLERHDPAEMGRPLVDEAGERLAAVAAALAGQAERRAAAGVLAAVPSGWRNSPSQMQRADYRGHHGEVAVGYRFTRAGFEVEGRPDLRLLAARPDQVRLVSGGEARAYRVHRVEEVVYVDGPEGPVRLVELPRFPATQPEEASGSLRAPMPGRVVRVEVDEGDRVGAGQVLVVMEAMKMEHSVRVPHPGVVREVSVHPGDQVEAGAILVIVESQEE